MRSKAPLHATVEKKSRTFSVGKPVCSTTIRVLPPRSSNVTSTVVVRLSPSGVQPVEAPLPLLPVHLDPLHRVLQAFGTEAAVPGPSDLLGRDQPRLLEDLDVLLHPGEGDAERLGQLADGRRPPGETDEDPPSRRIRQ